MRYENKDPGSSQNNQAVHSMIFCLFKVIFSFLPWENTIKPPLGEYFSSSKTKFSNNHTWMVWDWKKTEKGVRMEETIGSY